MPGPRPASWSVRLSSLRATNAFVPLTPVNGVVFQGRRTTGGSSTTFNYGPIVAAPYWVRLVRAGNTFSASISADGATWTVLGQTTLSMASQTFVGLAVSSHHNGTLSTAVFDNVTVSAAAPPPPDTQAPTMPTGTDRDGRHGEQRLAELERLHRSAESRRHRRRRLLRLSQRQHHHADCDRERHILHRHRARRFHDLFLSGRRLRQGQPGQCLSPSGALSVTTQSTVASSWSNADIGAVNAAGSFTFDGSTFTVNGLGGRRLQQCRRIPVRLPDPDWRRLDHGPRGQPDQHQRLGQGRRHVPRDSRSRFQECLCPADAGQRRCLPGSSHRRRFQHHFHLRSDRGRSVLGASGPCRQHPHRLHLRGRGRRGPLSARPRSAWPPRSSSAWRSAAITTAR